MKTRIDFDKISLDRFNKAFRQAASEIDDLRVPLNEIALEFLESRKFIFALSGPGQYKDLSSQYKKRKNPPYPILKRSGRLARSITRKNDETFMFVGYKSLEIGTTVPYGAAHQYGTRTIPKRPFLFWGPESKEFANAAQVKKSNVAMAVILFNHIERTLGKTLKASVTAAERKAQELFK